MDNTKCHVCGKKFGEDDDNIVYCPECHAYHHEKCWNSNGGCGNKKCIESPQHSPETVEEACETIVREGTPLERSSEILPADDERGWLSRFFKNPGRKIKAYAKYSFIVETILLWIASFVFFCIGIIDEPLVALIAVGAAVLALPVSYVMALPIYAFGELVDRSTRIDKKIK